MPHQLRVFSSPLPAIFFIVFRWIFGSIKNIVAADKKLFSGLFFWRLVGGCWNFRWRLVSFESGWMFDHIRNKNSTPERGPGLFPMCRHWNEDVEVSNPPTWFRIFWNGMMTVSFLRRIKISFGFFRDELLSGWESRQMFRNGNRLASRNHAHKPPFVGYFEFIPNHSSEA